jgi:DNA-binding transcriptional LysR family regulator
MVGMTRDQLRRFDLNLLVTLDALLTERSVSGAARALTVSPPTVSAALGRLRRHFDDELLVRTGRTYELSPLGARLAELTAGALEAVSLVADNDPPFDPSSAERQFTVALSDYALAVWGPALVARVADTAPQVSVRLLTLEPHTVARADEVLRRVDGVVLPHGLLDAYEAVPLFDDTWSCIMAIDHPAGREISVETAAAWPWVVTNYGREQPSAGFKQLLRLTGIQPTIDVTTESFVSVPFLVGRSHRLGILQTRLANELAPSAGVRVVDPPCDVLPIKMAFWWHPMRRHDPGHTWFRKVLAETANGLAGGHPTA